MKKILLNNKPVEHLDSTNDYLNLLPKSELIKFFLENNTEYFDDTKMFVLYGSWGSGKSTVMKYLESKLDEKKFKTFFFEAWEHEKDKNLSFSLVSFLYENATPAFKKRAKVFLKKANIFLRGFTNSISVETPSLHLLPKMVFALKEINEANYSGNKEKEENKSFYKKLEDFKKNFHKLESNISEEKEYNIVFIDDLDRCEPENVLNLLSAIKLFYTYGKKTIFFCGIDKDAVKQAIATKYSDIVKSEEYLEKVFDISFNMPAQHDLGKLAAQYFIKEHSGSIMEQEVNFCDVIVAFFNQLNFTNPRHVKKVLNKYQIVRSFKEKLKDNKELCNIPNINTLENEGSIFETILVLFIIILYDFFPNEFNEIKQYDLKRSRYFGCINMYLNDSGKEPINSNNSMCGAIFEHHKNCRWIFKQIINLDLGPKYLKDRQMCSLYVLFSPLNIQPSNLNFSDSADLFIDSFNLKSMNILTYFIKFLGANEKLYTNDNSLTEDFSFLDLIKLAETLL